MAQEPSFKELLEAVKQQESGGRRYDKSGKLLEGPMTKYGTAKGVENIAVVKSLGIHRQKEPGFSLFLGHNLDVAHVR